MKAEEAVKLVIDAPTEQKIAVSELIFNALWDESPEEVEKYIVLINAESKRLARELAEGRQN